ncbi:MAG: VOC family protein [Armatimonadetes bacterium]|nr:VOC family protein [Armatimonadota bacterium]
MSLLRERTEARVRVLGLDHWGMPVRDLAESERFYCGLLGMTIELRLPDQILLRCGHQNMGIFHAPYMDKINADLILNPLGKPHHAFLVENDDFERFRFLFNENKVPTHGPIEWGDHQCCYFLDPSGNLLELVNYGERDRAAYP